MSKIEEHQKVLNGFIELANKYKEEGYDLQLVSAAMMSASATYSTYIYAGNDGYLQEGGITKVLNAYNKHLVQVQGYKKSLQESK